MVKKIIVSISQEINAEIEPLKVEFNISASEIHKTTLENFSEKREYDKWEKGAKLASKDEDYLDFTRALNP